MNILFLTTHVNTGGITSYLLTLGEGLVKTGNKVIIASSGGNCVDRIESAGIKHIQTNIRTKSEVHPKLWFSLLKLIHLIKEENIQMIHAQTRVTQVLGTILSRITGIKMITTCHGFFRPRWFRKKFPCWGDAVIAISKPVAEHLIKDFGVDKGKVHLIFNGIDLEKFKVQAVEKRLQMRQHLGMTDAPLIGIIARLSDVKGINVLIKAMPLILNGVPRAHLLIVGQGPEENNLKKLTGELSLGGNVHFKNIINKPFEILGSFDVFVMPSLMEGLGLSVMEAQACGVPVVASRVGGLVDLIDDGKTGFLVPVNDSVALAQRIIEVLLHPNESKVKAQQARLNIERQFSAQVMLNQTQALYEQYTRH